MARAVRDSRIDSRSARQRLKPQPEPYWRKIARGRYIGYRRAREGGSWVARYRDDAGRQHYRNFGSADDALDANGGSALSFDQAQERAREWFLQLDREGADEASGGRYTVADCMADYLGWVQEHRKSHRHLKTYTEAYILPRLGAIDTSKLTTPMIRRWHQQLAAEPPRARTGRGKSQQYRIEDPDPAEAERKRRLRANRHLVTLRAALSKAWLDGRIARNDAWTRVRPFPGVERPRSRFLNHNEARRLLNACRADLRQLVQLALLTGARYGELCALSVRDFQTESGTLFVRDSKSGKPRHIVLNAEGVACCRQLSAGRPINAPLLARSDGSRWSRDHQFRPFKAAIKVARLDATFTFHELRHTWASLTIMAGAPLMVVAQNLGHRDTRMVERHYGHLADSYVSEMIRKTAPSFGEPLESNVVPLVG
ncbi:MAG TPA: tyrosine-type recombinase/integrase [Stellaceae bacterium]|nr:tyrosine-type recombinase/integrase [Stellaceae bacterium]